MVRTRKKDYTQEVMQREHHQTTQPTRGETVGKAGTSEADHFGRRNSSMVFSRFQQLPCEIRLMIWKAVMTPRLVAITPRPFPKSPGEARNRINREISLLQGIPALLAVNQESRYLALRHYTWRFTIDFEINAILRSDRVSRRRSWFPYEVRSACVVMSPDDTLGIFRSLIRDKWVHDRKEWIGSVEFKVANHGGIPWKIHETTDAPQSGPKKVAILAHAVESNPDIIRELNMGFEDLDSVLHAKSAGLRTVRLPHTKREIGVESCTMNRGMNILGWTHCLYRPESNGQSLDILAAELKNGGIEGAEDPR